MDAGSNQYLPDQQMIRRYRFLPLYHLRILVFLAVLITGLAACGVPAPNEHTEVGFRGLYSASFNRTTSQMVLGSIHHGGSFWTLHPPAREFDWNHQADQYSEILYSALSSDGEVAVTADYHNLAVWSAETGRSLWFWSAPARIRDIDLSADGRTIILGLANGSAVVFDAIEGGMVRELQHDAPILSVSLSGDGRLALAGTEGRSAQLWDLVTFEPIKTFLLPNQIPLVKLSSDGRLALISPGRDTTVIWDIPQDQLAFELDTSGYRLYSARFDQQQRLLVGTTHRRIMSFDMTTGERLQQWQVGRFWQNAFQSTTVLDMNWHNDRLWALGSDGFLYGF